MRLRKFAFKTQLTQPAPNTSQLHLKQRMRTEIVDPQLSWIQTPIEPDQPKQTSVKFKRYSGQLSKSRSTNIKTISSVSNLNDKNRGQSQRKKIKYQTISQNQTEISKVQSHLQSVLRNQRKPTQLHKRMLTLPLGLKSSRRRRDRSAEVPMQWNKYSKCCEIIDEIYSKINVLKEIGYSDAKIDFWFLTFCESRKPFMKHILMRNINFSLYSLQEEYSYEQDSKMVKDMIRYKLRKGKDIFNYIQPQELQEFCRYLQQILIRKNSKKVKQIQQSITDKMYLGMAYCIQNDYLVFNKEDPKEVYNFSTQLETFEDKFGSFESFSKINKLRHLQLNLIEKKLKNKYMQLINDEDKEIIRTHPTEKSIKGQLIVQ